MRLEWFLNKEPLLFKSSFTPVYDYGFVALSITKVYPDDFGEFSVRVTNKFGSAVMESWLGELPVGQDLSGEEEPDLPAWCNKVEKGRLAVECPPEITKHLMDIEVTFSQLSLILNIIVLELWGKLLPKALFFCLLKLLSMCQIYMCLCN